MDVDMPRAGTPRYSIARQPSNGPRSIGSGVDRQGETTDFDGVRGTSPRMDRNSNPNGVPPSCAKRVCTLTTRPLRSGRNHRWTSHRLQPYGLLRGESESARVLGATNGTHAPAAAATAAVLARLTTPAATSLNRSAIKSTREHCLAIVWPGDPARFDVDRDD